MKKKLLLITLMAALLVCALAIFANAAAPMPSKPDLGVSFGDVTTIDGFTAPSELYAGTTERVLLVDENGNYATYPTYYVTKNNTTFDFDFSKLNGAQSIQYAKKSVVMVEIPTGVTTISGSYFAGTGNFPACVSVQFPGTVTSYGNNMFQTNSVIRVVEMMDGTEPITIGDGIFSSDWSTGTTKLEYVKFPNNLVSIGNNTFGKSHANKTIIFGANLQSIGTGFFGESTPDNKETFLYVSDNFFKNTELFKNLFGGYDQYHNSLLKITMFYTGTQEQAQALVDKGLAVQTGYIWSNLQMVNAENYERDTYKPARNSLILVYGVDKCDVFYGGHRFKGEDEVVLNSYFEGFGIGDSCVNCEKTEIKESFGSMFSYLGYSCTEAPIGGKLSMSQFYGINKDNIAKYEELTGTKLTYGVVIASVENPFDEEYVNSNKVIVAEQWRLALDYANVMVSGITEETAAFGVLFCMYVNDGGNIYYLDGGKTNEAATLKSYNDVLALKKAA